MRRIILIILLMFNFTGILQAQEETTFPDDAVYAILFYLPTCPHCHEVMENDLPGMFEQYGDKFVLLIVNVSEADGGASAMMGNACNLTGVTNCGGVPMLTIGNVSLKGSIDIPTYLPGMIEEGIAAGGIPLPDLPGIESRFERGLSNGNVLSGASAEINVSSSTNMWDNFTADPSGNLLAVAVLAGLIASIVLSSGAKPRRWIKPAALIAIGAGAFVAFSLLFGEHREALPTLAALTVTLLFGVAAWMLSTNIQKDYLIPIIAVAGLIVAAYLAYIETSDVEAVCGAVGDCASVQQSSYAKLFGILPIGVMGIIGYVLMLVAWGLRDRIKQARTALFFMAIFGVLFSTYLTFLEPFVIGATCAWCITSALTMIALLWLTLDLWDSSSVKQMS